MRQPLILNYYQLMPVRQTAHDEPGKVGYRKGLAKFKRAVQARYNEASLERLLGSNNVDVRQAAVLALGATGTMHANALLAQRLHDEDSLVCELAADALWSLWFRADTADNNDELQRLMKLPVDETTAAEVLAGFETLIRRSPLFAEAYNQRAIVQFQLNHFAKSIADCEKVLRLNPFHFGAASGMAQCFMKQRKLRAALRNYRRAHRINPHLDGVPEVIQSLVRMLGEEGKR